MYNEEKDELKEPSNKEKLTIEELKQFKGFENISEEYAIKVIDELYFLSQILIRNHLK